MISCKGDIEYGVVLIVDEPSAKVALRGDLLVNESGFSVWTLKTILLLITKLSYYQIKKITNLLKKKIKIELN